MMNRLSDNRRTLFVCLFLAITAIAIYWQVSHCDFTNYDDNEYVTENSHVKTWYHDRGHSLGIHDQSYRILASAYLVILYAGLRVVRAEPCGLPHS